MPIQQNDTILVTGCAGFIGSNFTARFHERYPTVTIIGIDDFSRGRRDLVGDYITLYEGSVIDLTLLEKIFESHSPAYVFHFAALPRVAHSVAHVGDTSEVNVMGTVRLLDAARRHGVRRFVYSSSSAVYGNTGTLPTPETEHPDPRSPYAVQKRAGEMFCKNMSDLFGLDTVSLRYFNVFGPGEYGDTPDATLIASWLESLYFPGKKQGVMEGDGSQSRDLSFVDNVVDANIRAAQYPHPFRGEIINIAQGERMTIAEIKQLIEAETGKKLVLDSRPPRLGDVLHTHADITKARSLIGYTPQVRVRDGIARTVTWFKKRAENT